MRIRSRWLVLVAAWLALAAPRVFADGDMPEAAKPKGLSELIERADAKLRGGGDRPVVKKTPDKKTPDNKTPDNKTPDKPKDSRPFDERFEAALELAKGLWKPGLKPKEGDEIGAKLIALDVPESVLMISPTLTGRQHKWMHKIGWRVLAHYAPKVYSGDPKEHPMELFGDQHKSFRKWCADRFTESKTLGRAVIYPRFQGARKIADELAKEPNKEKAHQKATILMAYGEEHIGLYVLNLLRNRIENLSDKDQRATKHAYEGLIRVYEYYGKVNIQKATVAVWEKHRKRDWERWYRAELARQFKAYQAKVRGCAFTRELLRRVR